MPLQNRAGWNEQNEVVRDYVIREMVFKDKIPKTFQFQGLKKFTCGRMTNTVGVFLHEPTQMVFHLIPGDPEFAFGAGDLYSHIAENYSMDLDEGYQGKVAVKPFLISRYLISQYAWKKHGGASLDLDYGDDHPVEMIERDDVEAWGKQFGFKLPTEVHWEYACKAGSNTVYPWGNHPDESMAWIDSNTVFDDDFTNLTEAQQKDPNGFGLLGMIGNMGEWVSDDSYTFGEQAFPSTIPYKSHYDNADGILRGGWYNYDWRFNRSTSRIACGSTDSGCSARVIFEL